MASPRVRSPALLVIAALAAACSGDATNLFGPSTTSTSGTGGDATTTSTSTTTTTSTSTTTTTTGSGGAGAQGGGGAGAQGGAGGGQLGCSLDLHSVVDQNGNVVQTCAPDEGCSNAMCVEACVAAGDAKGNVGCDFVAATPHFYVGIDPPCFAMFVANNWPAAAHLTVERGGASYDVTQFGRIPNASPDASTWPAVPANGLPAGSVAVLFLSHDPDSQNATPLTCPVPPAVSTQQGTAVAGTGRGDAWHVASDVPISVYDILPYGGALSYLPSAELLLPTTAWGTNYMAVLPKDSNGPPWGQLVARQDGTSVQIVPTVALPGGNDVAPAPLAQQTTYVLDAGQYIQWQLTADMTGSIVQSDKPVSFTGGNAYVCYTSATSNGGGCDSAHQQVPPIAAFGSAYVGAPYATRRLDGQEESIPYRIVGVVAGTTLTYDPPVPGAPLIVGKGQKADFEATGAFVVASQGADHPFYLGQMMSGCLVTPSGDPANPGDEEFVNLPPPAQYLSSYAFFTDPSYTTTNLVLVREKGPNGFGDVTLDCLGTVAGWADVGAGGTYQIAKVDLVKKSVNQGNCANGAHTASSSRPFGIMVWGLATFASYAYPAGARAVPINGVVVPAIP